MIENPQEENASGFNAKSPLLWGAIVVLGIAGYFIYERNQPVAPANVANPENSASVSADVEPEKAAPVLEPMPGGTKLELTQPVAAIPENSEPEAPLCPITSCPAGESPVVFTLTASEGAELRQDQILSLSRSIPNGCLKIGDRVQLARFDRGLGLPIWMGEARLVAATAVSANQMRYRMLPLSVSPTETEILAPLCAAPCKVLSEVDRILEQKPALIQVGSTDRIMPLAQADTLNISEQDAVRNEKLSALKIPSDIKQPLVLSLPFPSQKWKATLAWLIAHGKSTGRPVYWFYPRDLATSEIPPSINGVTEVRVEWLTTLDSQKVTAVSPNLELALIPWSGTKLPALPANVLPKVRPQSLHEFNMIPLWKDGWSQIEKTFAGVDRKVPLIVMGNSIADFQSYYLARLLVADRRLNVYWYRSSAQQSRQSLTYDPLPPEFEVKRN